MNTGAAGRLLAGQLPGRRARPVSVRGGWIRNAFDTHYIPVAFAYGQLAPSGFIGEMGTAAHIRVSARVSRFERRISMGNRAVPLPSSRVIVGVIALSAQSASVDWPQWRGPDRNGRLEGDRAARAVAAVGPAGGVVGGDARRRLRLDRRARRSRLRAGHAQRPERRVEPQSRRRQAGLGPRSRRRPGTTIAVPGPRSTPTVDGDRLYVLTESGDLACLRVSDGTVVWQRNILKEFSGRNIPTGCSASRRSSTAIW